MNYSQRNKGITLVALVVTIIILIILATVSISAVIGEKGLIAKAKETKKIVEEAQKNEMEQLQNLMDSFNDIYVNEAETTNKISGTVVDSNKMPLSLVKVELYSGSKILGRTETDENGYFVFYNIPSASGKFSVTAFYNDAARTNLVTKPENSDVENVEIAMPSGNQTSIL